jgi:hypothetical protein
MKMKPTTTKPAAEEVQTTLNLADLNPFEAAEVARRLKAKGHAYLRDAELVLAWNKGRATSDKTN